MIITLKDGESLSAQEISAMGFVTQADMSSQLAPVAFSNSYTDLINKPAASGGAQVQTDWNATSGLGVLLNKPSTFTPAAHNQDWSTITATPITIAGYGITDAYKPSGTAAQYLRGDGSLGTLTAQVQADWNATTGLGVILNKPVIPTQKRVETYTGITAANGQLTIAYTTPFAAVPNVQPPPPATANQVWTLISSTINGFTIQLNQRNVVTLLSAEVLLGATVPVAGVSTQVLVVAQ